MYDPPQKFVSQHGAGSLYGWYATATEEGVQVRSARSYPAVPLAETAANVVSDEV